MPPVARPACSSVIAVLVFQMAPGSAAYNEYLNEQAAALGIAPAELNAMVEERRRRDADEPVERMDMVRSLCFA